MTQLSWSSISSAFSSGKDLSDQITGPSDDSKHRFEAGPGLLNLYVCERVQQEVPLTKLLRSTSYDTDVHKHTHTQSQACLCF